MCYFVCKVCTISKYTTELRVCKRCHAHRGRGGAQGLWKSGNGGSEITTCINVYENTEEFGLTTNIVQRFTLATLRYQELNRPF